MLFSNQNLILPRLAVLTALLMTISACGGGGGGGGSSAPAPEPVPTSSEVSGNAVKGPLENTEITLTDAGGVVIDTFTGSGASFVIDLPTSTNFPVTVTSSGGVDSILGNDVSEQSVVLKSVIFSADQTVVNLNPFTTLLVDTANAKGGLTQANIDASVAALSAYAFGLPEGFDPVTSAMTDDNTPGLLMSFEAVFEVFRRVGRQTGATPNAVIAAIAADLSDDIIDGVGSDGIDAVSTALFNTSAADVLLESLGGTLTLDAGGANEKRLTASDLNSATGLVTGNVSNLQRAGLDASERTKAQAVAALNVALRSADAADKDALGKAVNFLQSLDPQNPPTEAETALVSAAAKASLTNLTQKNKDTEAASTANQNASQVFSNPGNNLPLAVDDFIQVLVGAGTSRVSLLANDTGLGDTPITIALLSTGAGGSVSLNTDNTVSFTPDTGFFGGVDVGYEVTDADGETTSATATLYVDDVPVVQNFDIETAVDTDAEINLAAVATGLGNAPVSFSVAAAPANGTLSGTGGVFVYSPNAGYAGSDSAAVSVEDADGDIAESEITIFVDAQPVAVDDMVTTPLNTPVSANPLENDTGLGNSPVTIALGSVSAGGTAVLNGSTVDFTPTSGFGGSATVSYTVTDADGDSDTGTLTILVDDIPIANDDSSQTTVGVPVTIAVLGNDSGLGNAPLSLSVTSPSSGSASVSGADVVYTPEAGFTGNDAFTYTIVDSDGDTASASASIFVDALPTAVNDTVDTQRDAAVLIAVLANDNQGNGPAAISLTSQPTNGVAVLSGSNIQYTPNLGFGGLDSFGYSIVDTDGDQSAATVSINVDDFPVLVDQNLETPLATTLSINLLSGAVGLADAPITLVVTVMPPNGTLVVTGTTADYTPNGGFAATDSFQYTATDNNGDVDTATIMVLANDTPAAGDNLGLETPVGVALNNIDVLANDIQLGNIPIVVAVDPATLVGGTTVVNGDNTINFTPTAGFGGQASFQYTVTDNDADTATASVQIFVEDTPTAVTDSVDTPVNTAINIDVLVNDTGKLNTPLTVTVSTGPSAGSTAVQPDNSVTYTPNAATVNTDNFNYTLTDSDGDASTAAVAVFMDDTPAAVDDNSGLTTEVATRLNIDVTANDTGAGNTPLAFTPVASANASVSTKVDGTLDYTPNGGFAGNDTFTYSFTDSDGDASGSATVSIFVNDTPVAVDDSAGTPIDTPITVDVLTNDTGKLNGLTGLIIAADPTGGAVDMVDLGAGTVRYSPTITGLSNNDSFQYQITDTDGQMSVATVNIGVGFAATDDVISVIENTSDAIRVFSGSILQTIDPLANDALGPDGVLQSINTAGATGTVAINGAMIDYTPLAGETTDSFQYTISSATLVDTKTATVTISVASVCTLTTVHCLGAGEEFSEVQPAIDAAVAGDWVKIRGGVYNHDLTDLANPIILAEINVSGTSGNPIRIEGFDNETAILRGWRQTVNGWSDCSSIDATDPSNVILSLDCDADSNSLQDEANAKNQVVVLLSGDYVEVRNLKVEDATRFGFEVTGSNNLIENVEISDSYFDNILVGLRTPSGNISNNVFRNIDSHHARHGAGILVSAPHPGPGQFAFMHNIRIENSILHNNGFQPDGQLAPASPGDSPAANGLGGGNSDGFVVSKICEDDKDEIIPLELNGVAVTTLCPFNTASGLITYNNADDGIDTTWGDSVNENNISFSNGPQGSRAYKVLRQTVQNIHYIGNVAMSQAGPGFEVRQSVKGELINNLAINNDGNRGFGISISNTLTAPSDYKVYNNVAVFNVGFDLAIEAKGSLTILPDLQNNWVEDAGLDVPDIGDPMYADGTLDGTNINTTFAGGLTIEQKVAFIRDQVKTAFTPLVGSPLIDSGLFLAGVHCATADDDGVTPHDPNDKTCRHWIGTAPDRGAFEFGL